jgi:hypothetical protein
LSQLAVDQGITQRAMFVAIGPRLNRRVMTAFRVYENELIPSDDQDANRVPFQAFTLENFIDALAAAGAKPIARELWRRYTDFERIYHLSMQEFVESGSTSGDGSPSSLPMPDPADISSATKPKRKSIRRVTGNGNTNTKQNRMKASADVTAGLAR